MSGIFCGKINNSKMERIQWKDDFHGNSSFANFLAQIYEIVETPKFFIASDNLPRLIWKSARANDLILKKQFLKYSEARQLFTLDRPIDIQTSHQQNKLISKRC